MMTKAINENFNSLIGKWKFAEEQKSTYTVWFFRKILKPEQEITTYIKLFLP